MHLFFKTTPCNYNILVASTIPIPFRNNLTHLGNSPWKFKPPSSSIFYLLPKNIFFSGSGEHIVGVETLFYSYEPIFKSKSLRGPPSPSTGEGGVTISYFNYEPMQIQTAPQSVCVLFIVFCVLNCICIALA